jgi:hypothetical protein
MIHRLAILGAAAVMLPLLVNAAEPQSPAATVSRYLDAAGRNQVSEMEVLRAFDRQAFRELFEAAGTRTVSGCIVETLLGAPVKVSSIEDGAASVPADQMRAAYRERPGRR